MSSRPVPTRIAAALALLLLGGCGGTGGSNPRESEQEFRERMREQDIKDMEADRKFEEKLDEQLRVMEKEDRLLEAWGDAAETANYSRTELDNRRMQLAYARYNIYDKFKFDSDGYECPPEAPIKGNEAWGRNAYIYHKPGWIFYGATIPEECFATEAQARKHGFRPSKIRR